MGDADDIDDAYDDYDDDDDADEVDDDCDDDADDVAAAADDDDDDDDEEEDGIHAVPFSRGDWTRCTSLAPPSSRPHTRIAMIVLQSADTMVGVILSCTALLHWPDTSCPILEGRCHNASCVMYPKGSEI